jgi:plastocyanin
MRTPYATLVAVVLLAAGAASAAETKVVSQKGKTFLPEAVALTTADTLRINNDDAFLHHVYVKHPNLTFDSGGRRPGEPVDIQFAKPGSYEVLCEIHPKMKLVVEVK